MDLSRRSLMKLGMFTPLVALLGGLPKLAEALTAEQGA